MWAVLNGCFRKRAGTERMPRNRHGRAILFHSDHSAGKPQRQSRRPACRPWPVDGKFQLDTLVQRATRFKQDASGGGVQCLPRSGRGQPFECPHDFVPHAGVYRISPVRPALQFSTSPGYCRFMRRWTRAHADLIFAVYRDMRYIPSTANGTGQPAWPVASAIRPALQGRAKRSTVERY